MKLNHLVFSVFNFKFQNISTDKIKWKEADTHQYKSIYQRLPPTWISDYELQSCVLKLTQLWPPLADIYLYQSLPLSRQWHTSDIQSDLHWRIVHWVIRLCPGILDCIQQHAKWMIFGSVWVTSNIMAHWLLTLKEILTIMGDVMGTLILQEALWKL